LFSIGLSEEEDMKDQHKADNERHKKLREKRLAKGLCARCGNLPFMKGHPLCLACDRKAKATAAKRRGKAIPLLPPSGNVWDFIPDSLTVAIQEAERDLQAFG
jgi:hypothetical protein